MSAITTHVLDTVLGKPAAGIAVRLEKLEGGGWLEVPDRDVSSDGEPPERVRSAPSSWVEVAAGATDADGRCRELAPDAPAGDYRLTFDTGSYFKRLGRTSIYPEISIAFTCDGKGHFHLPLLLSDNSYTTYRGS
jgi:5-hydroxyisourate hydrolase